MEGGQGEIKAHQVCNGDVIARKSAYELERRGNHVLCGDQIWPKGFGCDCVVPIIGPT